MPIYSILPPYVKELSLYKDINNNLKKKIFRSIYLDINMEEEEKKDAYDNVDIIYEDDDVIFVKIYNTDAAKYFGPEYLSRRYNYYSRGNLYVIYDKNTNTKFVIHDLGSGKINVLDGGEHDKTMSVIEDKYPVLKEKLTEIFGGNTIYSVLKQIKNGLDIDEYELNEFDNLITKIRINPSNLGSSTVELKFDSETDFFKIFDLDDDDISFLDEIFNGGYYSDYIFYSYDNAEQDWNEGYIAGNFNEENMGKFKTIINFLSPGLIRKKNSDFEYDASKLIYNTFDSDINNIIIEYQNLMDECTLNDAKKEIKSEISNPFKLYGIIEITPFYKYKTSINVLLYLFEKTNLKLGGITDVLKKIMEKKSIGPYAEYRYEFGCKNFDNDGFNKIVSDTLDDILEKMENVEFFADIEGYKDVLNKVLEKYPIGETFKLPRDKDKSFRILSVDPKTNKILLFYNNYKGMKGNVEKRKLTIDEFFSFLYSPELFESKIVIKSSLNEDKSNKIYGVLSNWMNENFGPDQLEVVTSDEYPNSIFYRKNGEVVMEQNKKTKDFWFDYNEIWSIFERFFGMEYKEIQSFLRYWLEETLNLEGFTPNSDSERVILWLEETLNLEGFTPIRFDTQRYD